MFLSFLVVHPLVSVYLGVTVVVLRVCTIFERDREKEERGVTVGVDDDIKAKV